MKSLHRLLPLLLLSVVTLATAQVPEVGIPGAEKRKNLDAHILPEISAAAPGKSFRVAVSLEPAPGWHTYGKTIPDGVPAKPTSLIWTLPEGWKAEELPWPPTKTIESAGEKVPGYDSTTYIGVTITPPASAKPGSTVKLEVRVDAVVCEKTCVPVFGLSPTLDIKLAAQPETDGKNADIFKAIDAQLKSAPPSTGATASAAAPRDGSLAWYLLLAFLGGMILNIMPCVFPVLAIKITTVVSQAHEDKRKLLMHGLAYTFGVLVSLWVLASVLLALRTAGAGLGWGFQLQSPWFVYIIVLIMVVFGLNMAGLFEVGTSAVGAGGELSAKSGLAGSFFSGLFATVVATPCTAPLLANALPVALSLPAAGSLAFFTVIGLGLASPYLVLSLMPALLQKLPRPGAWMESFKQGMSFLMLAAAGYFIWVLLGLISDENQRDLLIGLSVIAMGLWIYGRWCPIHKPASTRIRGYLFAILVLAFGIWWSHPREKGLAWEKWSPQLVQQLRDEEKPVYVDFTARWCTTCQVNHRLYDIPEIRDEIKKRGIILVKADWTDYDPVITKTLHEEFNAEAVPVNVLYIPGKDKALVLPPGFLTVGDLKKAFEQVPLPNK